MSFQEQLKRIRELSGLNENVKSLLERMTGKELVSYEGIDALVAALMGFYNVELKKKAPSSHTHGWGDVTGKPGSFPPSSHTHDDRYYTESEINEKFKNFCPIPLGGVLTMWNNTNPTSLYLGTTWELISAGKYIKTGSAALQTGGNNSITLTKDNLPNTKVKVDSFSATLSSHYHHIAVPEATENALTANNYMTRSAGTNDWGGYTLHSSNTVASIGKTSNAGGGSTGTVSPSTEALGSGNAITIQPEFITLKFWKRTS